MSGFVAANLKYRENNLLHPISLISVFIDNMFYIIIHFATYITFNVAKVYFNGDTLHLKEVQGEILQH